MEYSTQSLSKDGTVGTVPDGAGGGSQIWEIKQKRSARPGRSDCAVALKSDILGNFAKQISSKGSSK